MAGLVCLAKKKKKPVMVPAAPVIVEEHEAVHETIATGPGGVRATAVEIEDDVIIHGAGGAALAGGAAGCCEGGPPCERPGPVAAQPPPRPGHPHNC